MPSIYRCQSVLIPRCQYSSAPHGENTVLGAAFARIGRTPIMCLLLSCASTHAGIAELTITALHYLRLIRSSPAGERRTYRTLSLAMNSPKSGPNTVQRGHSRRQLATQDLRRPTNDDATSDPNHVLISVLPVEAFCLFRAVLQHSTLIDIGLVGDFSCGK
jgi:hypothetical protein